MHHPGLLLVLLVLALLLGPLVAQGLASAGNLLTAMAAGSGVSLPELGAPMLFLVILMFGVLIVGALKVLVGL